METEDQDMTGTWTLEPFQKRSVIVQEDLVLKSPLPHLTVNGQVPKPSNQNLSHQHFPRPTLLPYLIKVWLNLRLERQIWALSPVCLLGYCAIKTFLSAEDYCLGIWPFSAQRATSLFARLQQQRRGLGHRQPGAWPRVQFLSHAEPKHQAA